MLNKLLPKESKNRKLVQKIYYESLVPKRLSKNFTSLNNKQAIQLKESFIKNLYPNSSLPQSTIDNHYEDLVGRHKDHQIKIIPWIDSICSLKGSKILEIGCGNGTSTVALAEQGAIVTAIDIDENLLNDAKIRCEIYNLKVDFHLMNATEVSKLLSHNEYDMIIFYAVLEHMTYDERLIAIKETYDMLPVGCFWCIIDTPNRLHYYDSHTTMMPFFHWLPDELAIKYAKFSSRSEFKKSFEDVVIDDEKKLEFLRWGRGMSYHEFELSVMPIEKLKIKSTLSDFLIKRSFAYYLLEKLSLNYSYISFFQKKYPHIHSGFFQPFLNIIIQKD